jgi:hypothetical protein
MVWFGDETTWPSQLLPFPRLADGAQVPPSPLFSAHFLRFAVTRRTGVQVSAIAAADGGGRGGIPFSHWTMNITQKATGSCCTDSQLLVLTAVCDLAFAPLIPLTIEKWKKILRKGSNNNMCSRKNIFLI